MSKKGFSFFIRAALQALSLPFLVALLAAGLLFFAYQIFPNLFVGV